MHYVYKIKTATCETIPLARTNGEHMGGARAMKAPRCIKSNARHVDLRSLRSRFFLRAYTTSHLRTFRRTCVHVRKECSLEISVGLEF